MDSSCARKFTLDVSSAGAAKLRETVKAKLSEFIDNYTDDVLAEYVVVLVGHGKQQAQAVADLEAFLGGESEAFVAWLWDHLSANKHLYGDSEQQHGHSGRSAVSVKDPEEVTRPPEPENLPPSAEGVKPARQGCDLDISHRTMSRGHRRDVSRHSETKRSRSPELWTRRGRGRYNQKDLSPSHVRASRRLLVSAVRDAVAPSGLLASNKSSRRTASAFKRLQSVVSTEVDVQENGCPQIGISHADAMKQDTGFPPTTFPTTSLEDANNLEVTQERHSTVWDRLGNKDGERSSCEEMAGRGIRADDNMEEEGGKQWLDGTIAETGFTDKSHRWRTVSDRNTRNGCVVEAQHLSKSSTPSYGGGKQQKGNNMLDGNGLLSGDVLPKSVLEQSLPVHPLLQGRSHKVADTVVVQSHKPSENTQGTMPLRNSGMLSDIEFSQAGGDNALLQPGFNANDVIEMKRRMRQVELEMTKLRARQAEVSKDVHKPPPVSGMKPLLLQPTQEDINARSIYVSNVHFAASREAISVHFGHCGDIVRVTLLTDAVTGKPKGSAYVEFSTKEAMEKALTLNETSLLSRTLKVTQKDAAVLELATPSVVHPAMRRPLRPAGRSFLRGSILRGNVHTLRRSTGTVRPSGTSIFQWKREPSGTAGSPKFAAPSMSGVRSGLGPLHLTRSLSYVRVAPYTPNGTRGTIYKS